MLINKDGKYQWVYDMPMLKSLTLLLEVWKVLAISAIFPATLIAVSGLVQGDGIQAIIFALKITVLVYAVLFVLSLPSYLIVTKANNNKYTVLFEMDEYGVKHTQLKTDKAKLLENISILVASASHNYSSIASTVNAAAGVSLYSPFSKVTSLAAFPAKNTIRVNGRFSRNMVYADSEDFEFVWNFLVMHCQHAQIKRDLT